MTAMTPASPAAPANVQHLDHINLTVRDLPASLAFYQRLFGFEVVEPTAPDPTAWAIVRSGDAMLCLYSQPDTPDSPRYPSTPVEQGMRHFALCITNGIAFQKMLQQEELPLLFGSPGRWPHSTAWHVADPTGHQIEVVQ